MKKLKLLKKLLNKNIPYSLREEISRILLSEELCAYKNRLEECGISTVLSQKAMMLLADKMPMNEIFKDCSLYVYGYDYQSPFEKVLGKNHVAGRFPFSFISTDITCSGEVTRFEIVSNDDIFCFLSGPLSDLPGSATKVSCKHMVDGQTFCMSGFKLL